LISGRVQGVGFRYFTQSKARYHRLSGWVRNRPDGKVEAEVQGQHSAVEEFVNELWEGPPLGRVRGIDWTDRPVVPGEEEFAVRY
jgi:acylphosphatase